jgi:hypothetical protein
MNRPVFCLTTLVLGSVALADSVTLTYAGSIASGHSAQATFTFDNSANTVTVRIANTMDSAHNATGARDLSALFWNFTNTGAMSATYNNTPIPNGPNQNTWDATNVSSTNGGAVNTNPYDAQQMWAFRNNLVGAPDSAAYGLSSAGLTLFGPGDMLQSGGPHPQPDGPDGTIVSPTGNAFDGSRPQYRSYVEFVFGVNNSFFPSDLDAIGVTNLRTQFDTGLYADRQVQLTLIPLPPAVWAGIGGLGLAAIAGSRVRRDSRVLG